MKMKWYGIKIHYYGYDYMNDIHNSSVVERCTCNAKVSGSIPDYGNNFIIDCSG